MPVALKYWLKFSSPERTVPQGVVPPAQLFMVPRTVLPVLSAAVLSSADPAAGPSTVKTVSMVIRRFFRPPLTYDQRRPRERRSSSTTDMPCAAHTVRMSSAGSIPGGNMMPSLVYSWLQTSRARVPSRLVSMMSR